jgi:hypothetical protein
MFSDPILMGLHPNAVGEGEAKLNTAVQVTFSQLRTAP